MNKNIRIISLVLALVMLLGICSFAGAEAKKGKGIENLLGLVSADPEFFDPLSILPEELAANYEKIERDNLDKQAGLIASYKSKSDNYQDFDVYCYYGGGYPLEFFALREAAMFNSVAVPMTDYGEFYQYSSYEVFDGVEYYTRTFITEVDGFVFEIVAYEKAERIKIGSSSRTFCIPSTCAKASEPEYEDAVAEFKSGAPEDYYYDTIDKITIYEKKLENGETFSDYAARLANEYDFLVEFVTRNGEEYVVLMGDNGDGTVDIGYCFEENGIGYDLCFTAKEDLFWEINTISQTILGKPQKKAE